MIKHISIGHESISLQTIHLDAENTACHHHSHLTVLLEREFTIVWHLVNDHVIVSLDVLDLLANLILEWTSLEPCSLLLSVEDWEVVERFWQDVDVLIVERI